MDSGKILSLPTQRKIESEAALWLARIDNDALTDEERAQFADWYRASPLHAAALEKLCALWDGDLAAALSTKIAADCDNEPAMPAQTGGKWSARVLVGSMAAGLALVVAVFALVLSDPEEAGFSKAYQTAANEQQTIELPDGSRMVLNTGSSVRVDMSAGERLISLDRGEAFFVVAHDTSRPFRVLTPMGSATALGTQFTVRLVENELGVVVTEGRVAVREGNAQTDVKLAEATQGSIELTAGQSAALGLETQTVSRLAPDKLARATDWQDGVLSFRGERLDIVAAEMEQYSGLTIDIEGKELQAQEIVVFLTIGDIPAMLEALDMAAGIQTEWVGDDHVRLYRN